MKCCKQMITGLAFVATLFGLAQFSPAAQPAANFTSTAKLIEGAKKEGQAVWYTTTTLDQSQQVVQAFEKKYPFVKVTLFRTGGGPLLNKMLTRLEEHTSERQSPY